MPVLSRPAILLAAATVAAGLLVAPGAALATPSTPAATLASPAATLASPGTALAAETTTELTAAEMKAAIATVTEATVAAGAKGWAAQGGFSISAGGSSLTGWQRLRMDRVRWVADSTFAITGSPESRSVLKQGAGIYDPVGDGMSRSALKMMGRPAVQYVFEADKSVTLDKAAPGPVELAAPTIAAGTRTVHEDGTTDYRFSDPTVGDVTLHADGSAVLTAAESSLTDDGLTVSMEIDYNYGEQDVPVPVAGETIDAKTLTTGIAYLNMASSVKYAATDGAAATRKAAKGGKIKVATLRKLVGKEAAAANKSAGAAVVKVKNITSGVRVHATNPWTKQSVAYTVKASGKKVVVKKA
ncbi:hypothetical protein Ait01nite_054350 [Actinoplanes italicus]|uniref:Htaa protein n=1 Tax=Actinoplanes italicus TaxID=113567 RepID=A0A2T0K871_9ACTN|nr:hypothetical protein [Actinoplanes italicus]PRX19031.1 hypothetical protein CLV67_111179 [Actinoplanes italicus]GIE32390.1 hypothetical protein Ait01nite_054350 [Actinoplanes italicus]